MKRINTLLLLAIPLGLLGASCSSSSEEPTENVSGVNPADLQKNPIQGVGAPKVLLETGQYTDGPVWHAKEGVLFFTVPIGAGDAPGLYRVRTDGSAMKVRAGDMKAGDLPVGNAVTKGGELITVEVKRISRSAAGADPAPIASGYPGGAGVSAFDTLNDVVVHENGSMYVTDPGYFAQPAPTQNRVYRVMPDGAVTIAASFENVPRPNGIALSPDQKLLYVGFERPPAGVKPYIEKFHLNPDGSLAEHAKFVELDMDASPDGIEVDAAGNLYVANKAGVTVFKADGKKIGNVAIPEQPTGLAFGGEDLKTLFITTQGKKIYSIKVNVPGLNQ